MITCSAAGQRELPHPRNQELPKSRRQRRLVVKEGGAKCGKDGAEQAQGAAVIGLHLGMNNGLRRAQTKCEKARKKQKQAEDPSQTHGGPGTQKLTQSLRAHRGNHYGKIQAHEGV